MPYNVKEGQNIEIEIGFSHIENGTNLKTPLFSARLDRNTTRLNLANSPTFIVTADTTTPPSLGEIIVPSLQTQAILQEGKVFILAEPGMVRVANVTRSGIMLCHVIDYENGLSLREDQNVLTIQSSSAYAQIDLHGEEYALTFIDVGKPRPNAEIQKHMTNKTKILLPHMAFLQSRARRAFASSLPPAFDGSSGSTLEP